MPSYSNRPPMRSPFDAQVHFLTGLARAGVDALRRLSELNLQLARQLNDDAINAAGRDGRAHAPRHPPE